jgi:glycine/D-amino acid oxidase-like deaminating enzyme
MFTDSKVSSATRSPPPVLESQQSYWAATATAAGPPEVRPLVGSASADVCIIGGGYLGLSAALHLAESGASVVVLEAVEPGWGASGRNGGQIIPYWKVEHSEVTRQHGPAVADRLAAWASGFPTVVLDLIQRHGIDCDARLSGWIQPAHSYALLQAQERKASALQAQGIDVNVVYAERASHLLGTGWYKGAFIDRRGARLHPLSYARGLARAAAAAGARIYGRTLATHLSKENSRWRIATPDGHVLANTVLVCTNAYTDEAGTRPLIPGLAQSIVSLQSYMVATRPLPEALRRTILPNGETAADFKKLMHHFRLEKDGRFLFGGRGGLRDSTSREAYLPLLAKLAVIFPQLAQATIDFYWHGKVAITTDGGPHLHRPSPGLITAIGCNGRGVGMCTATGKLIAQLLGGMPDSHSPMPITALKRMPLHSLRLAGVQAAVWFKAWQDRRDYAKCTKRSM